jgi:hypothetical protein
MSGGRAVLAAGAALALLVGAAPPRQVPLPRPNPLRMHRAAPPVPAPEPPAPAKAAPPPTTPAAPAPQAPATPPAAAKAEGHHDHQNIRISPAAACQARLRHLGVVFAEKPPVKKGACGIAAPVEVTGLAGSIRVTPPALLGCPEAETFARWVAETVTPAAKAAFHAAPTMIGQASAYVCRTRDRIKGAKISEHAFGNAIDVARIAFAGHPTAEIGHPDGAEGKVFQAAIRRAACDYFTTVLGPGDAYHDTHLHLDREQRRSGFRLCE